MASEKLSYMDMDVGFPHTSGVTIKASPVEVSPPRFKEYPPMQNNHNGAASESKLISGTSSLLKGIGHGKISTGGEVVASKLDLDEASFTPFRGSLRAANSLISLCHEAFAEHRPMALTPDLLWHYISKGVAIHIHRHSKQLTQKFVHHKGVKTLTAVTVNSEPSADEWSGMFKQFRQQIEANLTDEGKAMITGKFTTTTEIIEDVSCIALMEAMARYFRYRMVCICGIPSVTLLGTKDDWIELKNRSQRVLDLLSSNDLKGDVSLSWWKSPLLSVLDKLIQCYDNPEAGENMDWMARIYKSDRESYGGHFFVCGWVNVFFPYLGQGADAKAYKMNEWATNDLIHPEPVLKKYLEEAKKDRFSRSGGSDEHFKYLNSVSSYPKAISTVNFDWKEPGKEHKMMLNAGPCCVSEQTREEGLPCPPGTLHAHFGWVIFHDSGVRDEKKGYW